MSDVSGLWSVWMIQVCQRAQMPGDSTAQFVAALREIAVNCEFSDLSDEMVRDQLVEKKPLIARIRERMLLEPELALQKALVMAGQIESAMAEAKAIITCGTSTSFQDASTTPARTSGGEIQTRPHP